MIPSPKGRSLELYFIDGKPDGMLTAEVFNWTGHVLMTPRTQITDALKRREASFTGVYLLIGEHDGEPLLYIGEAEDVSYRIRQHDSKKDWWNTAVLITSAANNLNKAHVKYLEARLIEVAREVGRVPLENGTNPTRTGLTEAAQANMEAFLDYIFMVLPALRVDAFLRSTRPSQSKKAQEAKQESALFELQTPKHGIHAVASLEDGEFVVQEGSLAREAWTGKGTKDSGYAQLHAELVRMGILAEQPGNKLRVFTANYAFKSPSAAAAVINGRPANGTIEWKVKGQSITYKQWEARQLASNAFEEEKYE